MFWDFEPGDAPRALRAGQRANHFPGSGAMTSKATLATLRLEGPGAAAPATPPRTGPRRRTCGRGGGHRELNRRPARAATRAPRRRRDTHRTNVSRVFARGDFGTRRRRAETRAAPAARRRARLRLGRVRARALAPRTDGERRRERRRNRPAGFSGAQGDVALEKTAPISVPSVGVWERSSSTRPCLPWGRARRSRPARPRAPAAGTSTPARLGRVPTGRADGVARSRARVGRAVRRRRGGGGQETRDGDHRRGDGRRRAVCRLGHSRRERERERCRKRAPLPDRVTHFFETFRFDFVWTTVGVRGRAPDPVARRGERVAQPEARQRAAKDVLSGSARNSRTS